MSHIVTIRTQVRDANAIAAACQRLGLPEPRQGTAELFSGQATGIVVRLPGWNYPVVFDVASGEARYDNYEEAWGSQKELDLFLQSYAAERVKMEARRKGYVCTEQLLADGSLRLQVVPS